MNSENNLATNLAPASLIIGAGYVGKVLAQKLLALGQTVYATTRSQERLPELAALGVRPLIVDVTQTISYTSMRSIFEEAQHEKIDLYCLITPGRPNIEPGPYATAVEGVKGIIGFLDHQQQHDGHIRKAVMTSSTGVYPFTDGRKISADTPLTIQDLAEAPRSQLLFQSEQAFLSAPWSSHVVRLAGIYGPDRVIGKRGIRDGAPIAGDPSAILNLIHRDDAADVLVAAMTSEKTNTIELGSDQYPAPRIEYYQAVAKHMNAPPPPEVTPEITPEVAPAVAPEITPEKNEAASSTEASKIKQRATSKRCDNGPTKARLNWKPNYPSFHEGLKQIFEG